MSRLIKKPTRSQQMIRIKDYASSTGVVTSERESKRLRKALDSPDEILAKREMVFAAIRSQINTGEVPRGFIGTFSSNERSFMKLTEIPYVEERITELQDFHGLSFSEASAKVDKEVNRAVDTTLEAMEFLYPIKFANLAVSNRLGFPQKNAV